jgi:hypothetical protein
MRRRPTPRPPSPSRSPRTVPDVAMLAGGTVSRPGCSYCGDPLPARRRRLCSDLRRRRGQKAERVTEDGSYGSAVVRMIGGMGRRASPCPQGPARPASPPRDPPRGRPVLARRPGCPPGGLGLDPDDRADCGRRLPPSRRDAVQRRGAAPASHPTIHAPASSTHWLYPGWLGRTMSGRSSATHVPSGASWPVPLPWPRSFS